MLPLLLLLLTAGCQGTAVHEVAISVRSVRSVTYLGTQVSVFQHVNMPLRYFFQPLSFFDVSSVRVREDAELNVTRLHLDVYLWTEEFKELVRSHFPSAESVEMMPLTTIRVAWSQQAASWLGHGFNESLHLLDLWRDADKPPGRKTFTIVCDTKAACLRLQRRLNGSRELAESVFDLQYRVSGETSYNVTVAIGSAHFLKSPTFSRLRDMKKTTVFVDDRTVTQLSEEVANLALLEVHSQEQQRVQGERMRMFGSALNSLQSLLRGHPVESLSAHEWSCCVPWPKDSLNLRPDRLANGLNDMLRYAAPKLIFKENWANELDEAKENIRPSDFSLLESGLREIHASPQDSKHTETIKTKILQLVDRLGSAVQWKGSSFQPKVVGTMFAVDVTELSRRARLLVKNITVQHQITYHSDPLRPLPARPSDRGRWQPKFADSFCILAHESDPPGMLCKDLAYSIGVRSSIFGLLNLVNINATFTGGIIGRNRLFMPEKSTLDFSLRICCTKP